ncbi:M23 family metallopeptidase [Oceanobacillus senegalensis]|uniref:M23 family metallopeptidase n=1 Tax=Oceanobacillus senegalensis TaxID=1936063 RepID=UPI000A308BA7|nr:M23 family metallopeptidase [Oceanobacillus senegalensis]
MRNKSSGKGLQRNIPQQGKKPTIFKKIMATTCIALGLTFSVAYAEENIVETVFHVYIDEEHIGKVSNEQVVEDLVDQKLTAGEKDYDYPNLTIGEDITYIPEKVFNPTYNNEKVIDRLEDELTVMAEVFELKIGENTVGYFQDRETAKEVMEEYKTKFVDKEALEQVEGSDESNEDRALEVDESVITDVVLTEDVKILEGKSHPEEVLTKKEGIKLLEKGTRVEKTHQVEEGEVLSEIANKYDLSMEELLDLNPGLSEDSLIQIEQKITVLGYEPFVDVIVTEEKVVEETIEYDTKIEESDDMYKGEEKVTQEGQDGKKEVHYVVERINGEQTEKEKLDENVITEPVKKIVVKGTKVIPSRGTGDLSWPAVGGYVSSDMGQRWGRMHKGIDIAGPSNRNILAADNGVVVSAGYNSGGYGNKVVINHNNGMKTIYAHLSSIDVNVGQTVEKGHKLGVMGSTGNSTGIHLHFEVYKNGSLENPLDYL